ncbi:MAG: 2-dehydropantoate 2-reductase [Betaproteobacteria bacterium]|nr:2-dehydropantoate 2-reductase [Betaproteobacteria bacterium]
MKIAVIGAGGVGGYFGARLALAGEDITFIARGAHLDAMRTSGLTVRSSNGNLHVQPVSATDDAASVGHADYVMIATKLWSTGEAIDTARAMMGPDSTVVSFQNGVDAEDRLVEAFGAGRVLGGVANIAALIESPGVVRHNGTMAVLVFGELDGARSARVSALETACKRAGIDTRVPDDILQAVWEKFALLAPFSSLTSLTRLPAGPLREDPDTRALFRQLVEEVVAVGQARGIALGEATVTAMLTRLDSLPADMVASMLGDLLRGNRLELPWLSGSVVKMGETLNVPTPAHRFACDVLKLHANGRHPALREA